MDNIFIESLFKTSIQCNAKSLTVNIDTFVLESLKHLYEGVCNKHGYVDTDSITLIKRSVPTQYGSQLNGNIKYYIVYKAKICCPVNSNVIKCTIDKINKLGILCITHPMNIIVAKDFHKNTDSFKKLKEGDDIEIKIIDKRFNLNDKIIQVIAKLNDDDDIVESDDNQSSDGDTSSIEEDVPSGQSADFVDENKEYSGTDDSDSDISSSSDEEIVDSDNNISSSESEEEED